MKPTPSYRRDLNQYQSCPLQLLKTEEYQNSSRVSVYLSMPTEVDTQRVLEVRHCTLPADPLGR